MICLDCKKAGELNVVANRLNFDSVSAAEHIRSSVRAWHARCSDVNCTCQHIVGTVLDWTQVLNLKEGGANMPSADIAQRITNKPASEADK